MKKDIPFLKVEDLAVAVVPRLPHEEDYEDFWDAYLINFKEEAIHSVLVNSSGYGIIEGERRRTSALRFFWEIVEPQSAVKIEPLHLQVLNLVNEFWVSFTFHDYLYDKQYVFVEGSLSSLHFTDIPLLQRKGVMIR